MSESRRNLARMALQLCCAIMISEHAQGQPVVEIAQTDMPNLAMVVPYTQERVFSDRPETYAILQGTTTFDNSIKPYLEERLRRNRNVTNPAAIKSVRPYSHTEPHNGLRNRIVFNDGKDEILCFHDDGFEQISQILTHWVRSGKNLRLDAILDHEIVVGIGYAYLDGVYPVKGSPDHYLIAGITRGGDGGEGWGSVWFGLWAPPNSFKVLYEASHRTNFECHCEEDLSYELDPTTLRAKILKRQRKWNGPEDTNQSLRPWREQSHIEIDLKEYF